MSEDKDTLQLARGKWVSTEIAQQMIRAVAPPNANARQILQAGRASGSILSREKPKSTGWSAFEQFESNPRLPSTVYEWDVQSLTMWLLTLRVTESWQIPSATILKLSTIGPDQLTELELEKLKLVSEMQTLLPGEGAPGNSKIKATGRPIDPLWAQVLGHAAGWLARYSGGFPTRGALQKVIDERFAQLSSDPPDTSTTKKYARQMLDAFKKSVETE